MPIARRAAERRATSNGLNQQVTIGGAATWDAKGNLATEVQSNKAYCYSPENLLKRVSTPAAGCASPSATLAYDPLLRLSQVTSSGTTRFAYNGTDAVAEYDGSGNLLKRFIIDPTTGLPLMESTGSSTGTSFYRFYGADERGSVISNSHITGNVVAINRYDECGKPGAANIGRYQYTGQKWIGEAGLYDYKARDYVPHLGIFAPPDPIGYADNANLYAYVGNDPVNLLIRPDLRVMSSSPALVRPDAVEESIGSDEAEEIHHQFRVLVHTA